MAKSVSIAITARDNFSSAITSMRNANAAFTKDVSGLQTKLDALNKNKVTLKIDVNRAKQELKEAEKQFNRTGDAADRLKLEMANANYENARRNLSLVSGNARQAEKDIMNLSSAMSKAENRAGTAGAGKAQGGLTTALAQSGAAAYLGQVASGIANSYVGSAYGNEAGTYLSSALSGAGMGAAIGSLIPGIGTAVGAALGGIVGIVQGAVEVFKSKDEAFKEFYQSQYEEVTQAQKDALESGSSIASNREQKMISFSTLLGGDDAAKSYLGDMTKFSAQTPFTYDQLADLSKTLLAYRYNQSELIPKMTNIGDTGAALEMNTSDMSNVASYLGRMKTTGKTTMEYLNPLLERGIDIYKALEKMPEAAGKTNEEIQEMVSKGLIPGEQAAEAIFDYMGKTYGGSMEKLSQTYAGLESTLQDAQDNINNAMGEGYNSIRKPGMQDQIDWMSGESGAAMENAYYKIGQWQASLENKSEEFNRAAMDAVMMGGDTSQFGEEARARLEEMYQEYAELASSGAKDVGEKQGALLAEAQAIAQNEYNASEGAQLQLETQLTLADNLRNNASLNEKYWDAGYKMGEQFSLGMAKGVSDNTGALTDSILTFNGLLVETNQTAPGQAYGISYVPYDNFPAMLHEGERVLTASEARGYGGGVTVQVTGNSFVIREEADIDKVAKVLAREVAKAKMLAVE